MFSRFSPLALIRLSQDRRAVQDGRRTRSACVRHPDGPRAQSQLEGLEDRCLPSGISGITEFPAPGGQGPGGITAGPDGNIWFTETNANLIGEINPTTHAITEFVPPKGSGDIQGITSGPDGNVWFAEWGASKIGMINPTTDAITQFALPKDFAGPHMITAGPAIIAVAAFGWSHSRRDHRRPRPVGPT